MASVGASNSAAVLQQRLPTATAGECRRFHEAFSDKATERLAAYLEWRKEHQLSACHLDEMTATSTTLGTTNCDASNWQKATEMAIVHVKINKETPDSSASSDVSHTEDKHKHGPHWNPRRHNKTSNSPQNKEIQAIQDSVNDLPRVVYSHTVKDRPLCDKKGNRVLQILPSHVDLHMACANTYATAFSLYLDAHLDRDNSDQLTLLVDVRPGHGCPNLPAKQLVCFIRCVAQVCHDFYPGRLHQCVIFPVPRPAIIIWHMIQNFLDPCIRKSVVLVPGPATLTSPMPRHRLKEFVDDLAGLDLLEQTRLEAFCKE
jgi:hypothetical protein